MTQETGHTTLEAIHYTRQELIPHISKRINAGVPSREISKDILCVSTILRIQAEHLANSSSALVCQASDLFLDLYNKTERND